MPTLSDEFIPRKKVADSFYFIKVACDSYTFILSYLKTIFSLSKLSLHTDLTGEFLFYEWCFFLLLRVGDFLDY